MTEQPANSAYEKLRRRHAGTSLDFEEFRKSDSSYAASFIFATFLVLIAGSIFASPTLREQYWLGIAVAGAASILILVANRARKRRDKRGFTARDLTSIVTYRACIAVDDYLNNTLHETKKGPAIKALSVLINNVRNWRTKSTPEFMARPANNLLSALEKKAMPALSRADETQGLQVQQMLYALLDALDRDLNEDIINSIIKHVDQVPAAETKKESKVKINKSRVFFQKRLVRSCMIIIGAIVASLLWFYLLPVIFTDPSEPVDLNTRLSGFIVIIGIGCAAVTAYLFRVNVRTND